MAGMRGAEMPGALAGFAVKQSLKPLDDGKHRASCGHTANGPTYERLQGFGQAVRQREEQARQQRKDCEKPGRQYKRTMKPGRALGDKSVGLGKNGECHGLSSGGMGCEKILADHLGFQLKKAIVFHP
jgi:hypothetical protein